MDDPHDGPASPALQAPNASPAPATSPVGAQAGRYQSLYRRYRPQRFVEVRGQDHVVRALRNSVRDARVTHAYLFSGPRGTGKTSTARILAKALNCLAPDEGEPCGVCASCEAIAAGSSFDVHELDAASSGRVEDVRELVSRASLATPGRYKIYIVDEVHMLSTAASNALLKTLEEPPEHVVFVLATTDPQKVLPTIRSRAQHYEFHLLDDDVLGGLLVDVAGDAGLELPEGSLEHARRRARGSARDALSTLDLVAASGILEDDTDAIETIVAAVAERDLQGVLDGVEMAVGAGEDPKVVAVELVERLRSAFLALAAPASTSRSTGVGHRAVAGSSRGAAPAPSSALSPRDGVPDGLSMPRIVRALEAIGAAQVAMRDAPEPRISLEVALARIAAPEIEDSLGAVLERLERLEREVAELRARIGPASPLRPTEDDTIVAPSPGSALRPTEDDTIVAPSPGTAGLDRSGLDRSGLNRSGLDRSGLDKAGPGTTNAGVAPGSRPTLGAFRQVEQTRSEPSQAPGSPSSPGSQDPAPTTKRAASSPTPAAPGEPTRDEIVEAWGDQLLTSLRPRVKAVYGGGRFVTGETGDIVFAFPNAAHLSHAEPLRQEVADALSKHFGKPVQLRLGVDEAGPGEQGLAEIAGEADAGSSASARPKSSPGHSGSRRSRPLHAREGAATPSSSVATQANHGASSDPDAADAVPAAVPATAPVRASAPARAPTSKDGPGSDEQAADGLDELLVPDESAGAMQGGEGISPLAWAERRLLEAFPGAEEV